MKLSITLISCILFLTHAMAQTNKTEWLQKDIPADIISEFEMKEAFKQQTDSLFLAKQYDKLISIAASNISNKKLSETAKHNMIAAYYMKGDTKTSDSLISDLLNEYSNYDEASWLLSSNSIGMIQYLQFTSNMEKVVNFVINGYKNENFKEDQIGLQLLNLYLNDQWIRRNAINDWKHTDYSEQAFLSDDKKQRNEVFALYTKTKRLLTKEEVGEALHLQQFILLAHDSNMQHRDYYLSLIKEAVKDGITYKARILDFILRTEIFQKGFEKFNDTRDARIAELKKEYNITNYSFGAF